MDKTLPCVQISFFMPLFLGRTRLVYLATNCPLDSWMLQFLRHSLLFLPGSFEDYLSIYAIFYKHSFF